MERAAKKPIGYQKHITYELREKIEAGLKSGLNKTQIAKTIHKDPTTVAKEIRNHRTPSGSPSKAPFDCANYKKCTRGRECRTSHEVFMECTDYTLFKCNQRDRSPGVCNGCTKAPSCRFSKYYYRADVAQRAYEYMLRDSRMGFNLTYSEAQWMADIIKPELEQGKSPYAILNEHPELKISEKCLYNYIEQGAFEQFGINSLALRNQVKRRKMPKVRANQYRKRRDSGYLTGRTFKDFLEYNPLVAAQYSINHSVKLYDGAERPDSEQAIDHPVGYILMDTVYNDVSNGPFIQTFKIMPGGVFLAVYHDEKTAEEMVNGLDYIEKLLGPDVFINNIGSILTDRGSEFSLADEFEDRESGTCRIFYCDAMHSNQKGSLENEHLVLRYICPKKKDLRKLGLVSQEALNRAVNNINSYSRKLYGGRSLYENTAFMMPEIYEALKCKGYGQIDKDKVELKPSVLKKK